MPTNNIHNANLLPKGAVLQGKYRVDGYLASGGFGNTYVVTHMMLERRMAMKEFFMSGVVHREEDSLTVSVSNSMNKDLFASQKDKFKREGQRLSGISNEHIIKVHDLFEENGTVYYVMDYIDGQSLNKVMEAQGRPFTEDEVDGILPQILDALRTIHRKGIWHMDIKPGNIMMDRSGKCTLIDFGSSKQTEAGEGRTTSTAVSYTAGYAPPEQMSGNKDRWGAHTDFYALGASLYNLLTGKRPPLSDDILDGESAFAFPPELSERYRELIVWMMNPKREERPQSVEEIVYANLNANANLDLNLNDDDNEDDDDDLEEEEEKDRTGMFFAISALIVLLIGLLAFFSYFGSCSSRDGDGMVDGNTAWLDTMKVENKSKRDDFEHKSEIINEQKRFKENNKESNMLESISGNEESEVIRGKQPDDSPTKKNENIIRKNNEVDDENKVNRNHSTIDKNKSKPIKSDAKADNVPEEINEKTFDGELNPKEDATAKNEDDAFVAAKKKAEEEAAIAAARKKKADEEAAAAALAKKKAEAEAAATLAKKKAEAAAITAAKKKAEEEAAAALAKKKAEANAAAYAVNRLGGIINSAKVGSRTVISLPKPVYSDQSSEGTVVVNIVVNAQGIVTTASVASSNTSASLRNSALAAAKKARFSANDKNAEVGTITYKFKQR